MFCAIAMITLHTCKSQLNVKYQIDFLIVIAIVVIKLYTKCLLQACFCREGGSIIVVDKKKAPLLPRKRVFVRLCDYVAPGLPLSLY